MLRLAVVSSPRSGNTWMRAVLANSLGLDQFAVHDYRDLPKNIPENCAVQIHWYREAHFQRFLSSYNFRIIVLHAIR
jgi:hypothetical protein